MNPLNENDTLRQHARAWSGRLGNLAAEVPPIGPEPPSTQFGDATAPAAVPSRLARVLDHFRHRDRRQEHAADKLRAQEFIKGP